MKYKPKTEDYQSLSGVNIIPAAEPTANFRISLLLIFIGA